jgi:ATP-dependent exoDNAse (exonuclease V) beta subunit
MNPQNEIIESMPEHDYHSHPAISKHGLDLVHKAPALYRYGKDNPSESTPAMQFGTLAHLCMLEPDRYESETYVMPKTDRRTKEGKALYEEATLAAAGKLIVSPDDHRKLLAMRSALESDQTCMRYLATKARIEPSLFWLDPMLDVGCRARIDCVTPDYLIDYKTTDDASFASFSKTILHFRYHVQAAFYLHGWEQCTGQDHMKFVFIAQEKTPPYLTATYVLTPAMLALGKDAWMSDLALYRHCLRTDDWPGYNQDTQAVDVPKWMTKNVIEF